jgi:gliding motility-associated-like protein
MNRLTFWRFFPKIFYSAFIILTGSIVSAQIPTISSFTPTSGPIGTTVTIAGTNFDATPANNIVWFGAVKATVTAASATELQVTVPTGATYQPITVTTNGLTAYSGAPFNITFSSTRIIDATTLASKVDFSAGTNPFHAVITDLDGDGKPDLIFTNQGSNTISILRNTSTPGFFFGGSFESKWDLACGTYPIGIAVGDIDGDGKPDIAVANFLNNSVSVFRNTSTPGSFGVGSFAAKVDFPTGSNPYAVAIGDIDGDGKPDLSVTNDFSSSVSVLRNTSTSGSIDAGSFAAKVDFTTGTNVRAVIIGDIDIDGKPDLITGSYNDHTFSVLRNTSTPGSIDGSSFAAKVDFPSATSTYAAALGDIDGDNKPDLIFSSINDNTISIYRNTSMPGFITAGSFADRVDFTTGAYPSSISIGDLDGNNKPDIAVTNLHSNTVSLFRNKSTTGFITTSSLEGRVDFSTWTYPSSVAIGDIDGDLKPDITVINTNSNVVSVFRNIISQPVSPVITSFTPTSGPVGTTVTINGTNFNTTAANNSVWFGAVRATVNGGTSTQLSVTVPAGATYQPISVTDINIGLTAYSGSPFIVTFPSILTIDTTAFNERVNFPAATIPACAVASDIDGDGKPDLIVTNTGSNSVSVYRNTSSSGSLTAGSFAPRVDFTTGSIPISITIADIDGDGKPDMVVVNKMSNTVSVFRNTSILSSVTFSARVDFTTGSNPFDVAIGDIDRDGRPDLAVTNYADNTVSVLRNTGITDVIYAGSFAAKVDFTTGNNPNSVVIGDFNSDNFPDMVVTNEADNTITAFRNIGISGSISAGSFMEKATYATGDKPYDAAGGDIDGDGKPDLIVTNYSSNTVSVFRNKSSYGFMPADWFDAKVDFPTASAPCSVSIGDINGDGKPDLAVADFNSKYISVFRNKSISGSVTSQSFSPYAGFTSGAGPNSVVLSDLDGDSKPDMIVANSASNTVLVLRNTLSVPVPPVITSLTPASGAIGTTVTINGSGFSTALAENIVWFGAVQATVSAATATQLTVTVPAGTTYQPITVTVNGLTAFSSSPFTVTFPGTHIIDATAFAPTVDITAGSDPESVAISDIDRDGKPDLIVTNTANNTVSVFRNTSDSGSISTASFSERIDLITGMNPNGIAIGDLDGDGKQDIVVVNQSGNTVSIFRNISMPGPLSLGSFDTKIDLPTGYNPYGVSISDIDGDGKSDLAITNYNSTYITIYKNISTSGSLTTGSFAARFDFPSAMNLQNISFGDIDGDKKPDMVVANWNSNTVSIYRNASTAGSITISSFEAKVDFTTDSGPLGITFGDIDGDGKADLVIGNSIMTISIFRNKSSAGSITSDSFDSRVDFIAGSSMRNITIGDIDGDGKPDLAFKTGGNSIYVFKNMSSPGSIGTDSFSAKIEFNTSGGLSEIAIGDLDCDGKPDLVYLEGAGNLVSILRNKISEPIPPAITSITPAYGPIGTAVTITGTNFSTTPVNNIVWFGAVQATVTEATTTQLTVTVPAGTTYQPITVTVNGLTAYSDAPFNVTFSGTHIIDATAFASKVDLTTGSSPSYTSISDIDGDGKADLIVTNNGSNTVSVYRNISTSGSLSAGSFAPGIDFSTGTNPSCVTTGDIDGDGKQDIIVTNWGSSTISIFRNTSTSGSITNGSFAAKVDFATGSDPDDIAVGDIDGDGRPDIAVINIISGTVSIFRNTSSPGSITSGSLAARIDFATGSSPTGVAIGDIDGDGKQDIAISNYGSNSVSIFRNISTSGSISAGSFAPKVDFTTGTNPKGVIINDIDGDGKPDLTVLNYSDMTLSVFRNTSISGSITSGSFDTRIDFTTGLNPCSFTISDINGDSKPDLSVINNGDNTVSIFSNTSTSGSITSGSFAAKIDFISGNNPRNLNVGDLDGDGRQDLIVTNYNINTVSVLQNTISFSVPIPPVITSFTPTSGPIGSVVAIAGTNFSATAANNIVWFGAVQTTVTAASATELTVTVPTGATYQPITVTVNGLTAYSSKPFIVTFPSTQIIDATTLAIKVDFTTEASPNGIAIGDIDCDGKPDLVIANTLSDIVSVYRNISTSGSISAGSFSAKVDFATGAFPHGVAIGDIDGDGKPDLVVTNFTSNTVSVYRNTSTSGSLSAGSFAVRVDLPTGMHPQNVAIGDIDGDGKPDIAVTNNGDDIVSIFRNTTAPGSITAGSFAARVDFPTGTGSGPWGIIIRDMDGDDKPDLVVTNNKSNSISVYRNTSTPGSITLSSLFPITATTPLGIAIGDIDGDGKPDLVVTYINYNTVMVIRNTSTSGLISFDNRIDLTTGSSPTGVAIGDIDGDGKQDIVISNYGSNSVSIFRNISTPGSISAGSFAAKVDFNTGLTPSGIAIGDIDGDGKPDLVAANSGSYTVSVLRNTISASAHIPPVISSFTPASGPVGTTVTIDGTNFSTTPVANNVLFGTVQASVSSATATQLTVIVPTGATTQPISVTVNGLTANSGTSFTVTAPSSELPAITSFNPASGPVGTTVTIDGTNFSTNISDNIVMFGTVQAAVISATATQLSVIVPAGATNQPIYITVNSLTAYSSTSFIVTSAPVITSFTPTSGPVGTTVTIEGTNFSTTPADNIVLFGTVQTAVISATLTQLTVIVPAGATTQPITVRVNGLTTSTITSFTVTASATLPPVIMSFNPNSGQVGTTVTVTGSNFSTNISNNIVRFGTVQGAVISATATQLAVIVPAGATSQPIYVTVDGLTTYTSTSFIVIYAPTIMSFNPTSGSVGSAVTINGANFSANSSDNIVRFGNIQATVTAAATTQLAVIVPSGAITQTICVTVNGLTVCSGIQFTVTSSAQQPVINSFNPTSGPAGTTVIITGSNFSLNGGDNIVRFGNLQADLYAATSTQLTVTVPNGASSGPISVTVNGLTGNSNMPFNVTPQSDPPFINSFSPTSGPVGTTVTINGMNFSQNPENNIVVFGNDTATVTGGNQNQITVLVPEGADGQNISVTVNGQTAYSTITFTITTPQDIELESAILTLNGDGINERFVVKYFEIYGQSSIYVYNSRGAVVFWNKDFKGEWDLTVNGRRLDTGGYFYVIQTELGTFKGSFSILRR